jgi:hypothetical protein
VNPQSHAKNLKPHEEEEDDDDKEPNHKKGTKTREIIVFLAWMHMNKMMMMSFAGFREKPHHKFTSYEAFSKCHRPCDFCKHKNQKLAL